MSEIDRLLIANIEFPGPRDAQMSARPSRKLALLTCMDTRINPLAALGLEVGDAHILRNAGGRVTEDVLRSLVLSSAVLGVEHVVVMHHTRCGLAGVSDTELRAITGTEFAFLPIADSADAIREDVAHLAAAPYLGGVSTIAGFLYNVESGKAEEIARVIREK